MVQVQDITERKRTEEKLRLTQFSVDAASMSVFWIMPEGTFLYVNDAACQKLGYTREELLGMHIADVDPNYPREARDQFWETFEKNKVLTFESVHRTKDGRTFPVEITNHYLQFDGQKYEFAFAVDITERKQAEHALEHYAAELERSNEDLQQFAYTVSHDLQYPLRMVTQYLKLLLEHYDERLDETGREFVDWAMGGAERMKTLISDLLAYARVGSRGQALQPVDAEEVLALTLRSLCFDVEAQDAEITHDPLPTVMADEGQLGQVFQNLISNALKFHGDAPPRVHIAAARLGEMQHQDRAVNLDPVLPEVRRLEDAWVFSVRDNGIGIAPDDQSRIFGVFQRLHTEEEYPGTGIGLAICKRIIARHGGHIWVESQVGQGATFYFTLPVEDEGALARG
jgi:PAS domain S-box-containing protein